MGVELTTCFTSLPLATLTLHGGAFLVVAEYVPLPTASPLSMLNPQAKVQYHKALRAIVTFWYNLLSTLVVCNISKPIHDPIKLPCYMSKEPTSPPLGADLMHPFNQPVNSLLFQACMPHTKVQD